MFTFAAARSLTACALCALLFIGFATTAHPAAARTAAGHPPVAVVSAVRVLFQKKERDAHGRPTRSFRLTPRLAYGYRSAQGTHIGARRRRLLARILTR